MTVRITLAFILGLFSGSSSFSQISYGGMPLFPDQSPLKSSAFLTAPRRSGVIDMPAFDVDSVLRRDALYDDPMRGSFSFAHKFYTRIEREKDGNEWTLADGTLVWQVAIRSKGAYSINLLFTRYQVPEGARLFLYNTDHSYILGSYDHRNNSPSQLLPVQPVAGEAIIVEYSEPATAAFRGELTIGEVNHDYRDILRGEPSIDMGDAFDCMPDIVCQNVDEGTARSTLLLMIDGTVACTGTLMNNTSNDGAPYVLTAVHCLNSDLAHGGIDYKKEWQYYIDKAGTVVVFFNYSRPVCGHNMKASEEFSMASAYPRTILENKDIALLELREKPPVDYNAYYAGWNLDFTDKPYTNLHHPSAAVKRYNIYEGNLKWGSFFSFDPDSHLFVAAWTEGSTYPGSSGSPLFDANRAVVGGLSGGKSYCGVPESDAFFALVRGWETNQPTNQLKTYLDPLNTKSRAMIGWDPHRTKPLTRIGNAPYNEGYDLVTAKYSGRNSGFVFGNSSLNINEFAEEFDPAYKAELYGAFLLIPPITKRFPPEGVEIRVYEGDTSPEQLLAVQSMKPQFLNYSDNEGAFGPVNKNMSSVATENFVRFDQPITVSKKFFIAYHLVGKDPDSDFTVYNTQPVNAKTTHTAWINRDGKWIRSNEHSTQPVSASLAIQALLSYTDVPTPPGEIRQIRYIRSQRLLILPNATEVGGQLTLYTVGGQLIQRLPIAERQTAVTLHPQAGGAVAIVRIIRGNDIYTGKLIY